MSTMSDEEINKVADALALRMETINQRFWIEPEKHYLSHTELDNMVSDYRSAKGIFWKIFIGMIAAGAIISAGLVALGGRIK